MGQIIEVRTRMPFAEWASLPDHPMQRNTETHARRTRRSIHRYDHPAQRMVHAARIGPTGPLYKVDGHTRTWHWLQGNLTTPDTVVTSIFEADDEEDFNGYYLLFDAKAAAETPADSLYGLLRKEGVSFQSSRLKGCGISSALAEAWGEGDLRKLTWKDKSERIRDWKDELLLVDQTGLGKQHNNAVIAAMLLTFRMHGETVLPFWEEVCNDLGWRKGRGRDAVRAACEVVAMKYQGGVGISGPCARLLTTCEAWLRGHIYQALPRPAKLTSYRTRAELAAAARKAVETGS